MSACLYCFDPVGDEVLCWHCHEVHIYGYEYTRVFGCYCWSNAGWSVDDVHFCGGDMRRLPNWRKPGAGVTEGIDLPVDLEVQPEVIEVQDDPFAGNDAEVQEDPVEDDDNISEASDGGKVEVPLPLEMVCMIVSYLDEVALVNASRVSRLYREAVLAKFHEAFWEKTVRKRWPILKEVLPISSWFDVYAKMLDSVCCRKCFLDILDIGEPNFAGRTNEMRHMQLGSDLIAMRSGLIPGMSFFPVDDRNYNWIVRMEGPTGTPYQGGVFYISLKFPYEYPRIHPTLKFITKIFHPRVTRHGECHLHSFEDWDRERQNHASGIISVLREVRSSLFWPQLIRRNARIFGGSVVDGLVESAIVRMEDDFNRMAREWTRLYAMNSFDKYTLRGNILQWCSRAAGI